MPSILIKTFQGCEQFPNDKHPKRWRIEDKTTSLDVQKCQRESRNGHLKTIKRSKNDVTAIYTGQVIKACESLGVGQLEGEGRTLRHHPHLGTPTRIIDKNTLPLTNGIKETVNDHKNLYFENMKCHPKNQPCLDIAVKNHSGNDNIKKSEVKATEVTCEQAIKYEGNRRIKRKTIKTSEFSHIKTKTKHLENVDGNLNDRCETRIEERAKNDFCDWMKQNNVKAKKDRVTEYNENEEKLKVKLDEELMHYRKRFNGELTRRDLSESNWHRKDHIKEASHDEIIRRYSSESQENNTLSSFESDKSTSSNCIINTNILTSDVSMDSPPISINKEKWPDIKCKVRVLPKKEKSSYTPKAIIRIKSSEKEDSIHSSSSEQEWQKISNKPTAKFRIKKQDKYSSLEEEKHIQKSKSNFTNEYCSKESHEDSSSPTVMFRIKKPGYFDKYQNISNSTTDNTTSDDTSTLSSTSVHSIENHFITEIKANKRIESFQSSRSPHPLNLRSEFKESSFEKDFSSEDYSTHSSKEEEIKYKKDPIEIKFNIKQYEEESKANHENREKAIYKEYAKQSINSNFFSYDSSTESEETKSTRIFNRVINENKDNERKTEAFFDKSEIYSELNKEEMFETFRGTSEMIGCLSASVDSKKTNLNFYNKKSKSDSQTTKKFPFNSENFEYKFENVKHPNYLEKINEFEKENKVTRNENFEEIKNETISNLIIYDENLPFSKEIESSSVSNSSLDDKKWYQRNCVSELKNKCSLNVHESKLHPKNSKFSTENSEYNHYEFNTKKNSEEENKSSIQINKSSDKIYFKSDSPTSSRNDKLFQAHFHTNTTNHEEKEQSSQRFHRKYNISNLQSFKLDSIKGNKKETDENFRIGKFKNFEDLKKETLIINKYFDTKSFRYNSRDNSKDLKSYENKYDKNSHKNKILHDDENCTSSLHSLDIKQKLITSDSDSQEKNKGISYKWSINETSEKQNLLEIKKDLRFYNNILEDKPNKLNKTNRSSSICNDIAWHSINRKKDDKFSPNRHFSAEILSTKQDIVSESKTKSIDKLDFKESKSQNQSYEYKNCSNNIENSKDNDKFHFYLDTIKQLEKISDENRESRFKVDNKKIDSRDKHSRNGATRLENPKVFLNERYHNEKIEKREHPALHKSAFKFETFKHHFQDLTRENEDDEKAVQERCTVQVQLSHNGFRIKNWKEEVIIHRMLFASVNLREKAGCDITKPKNIISEKRFFVDAVRDVRDTCKINNNS